MPSGEEVGAGGSSGGFYRVSSQYETLEHMTLTCSSCSTCSKEEGLLLWQAGGGEGGDGARPAAGREVHVPPAVLTHMRVPGEFPAQALAATRAAI